MWYCGRLSFFRIVFLFGFLFFINTGVGAGPQSSPKSKTYHLGRSRKPVEPSAGVPTYVTGGDKVHSVNEAILKEILAKGETQ